MSDLLKAHLEANRDETRKKVVILNVDGGGVRGIIPVAILASLEKMQEGNIQDYFHIYTGASIGSIVAAALNIPGEDTTYKYSASGLLSIVKTLAPAIFKRSFLRRTLGNLGLFHSKYNGQNKLNALRGLFGNLRMEELNNMVMINAFDIHAFQTLNFGSKFSGIPGGETILVADATNASSAAPIYFPSYVVDADRSYNLVDGAMSANDPELMAYLTALHLYPNAEIHMLSLGTGINYPVPEYPTPKDWGAIQWVTRGDIAGALISGEEDLSTSLLEFSVGKTLTQYLRIEPLLPSHLTNGFNASPAYLDQLIAFATDYAESIKEELGNFFDKLL